MDINVTKTNIWCNNKTYYTVKQAHLFVPCHICSLHDYSEGLDDQPQFNVILLHLLI